MGVPRQRRGGNGPSRRPGGGHPGGRTCGMVAARFAAITTTFLVVASWGFGWI